MARDQGGKEQGERSNSWIVIPSRVLALSTVKEGERDHLAVVTEIDVTLANITQYKDKVCQNIYKTLFHVLRVL